ncbi:MAG: hypothetical protein U0T73_10360 [Chitinophagales bacterium]
MKKIFLNLSAIALIGLALASCNNDEANKKAMEADDAAVQSLVNDKAKGMDDEVAKACDEQVNAAAQAKYDSLMAAAKPGSKGAPAKKPAPHPIKKVEPKKDEPKKPSNNNRPGTNENTPPASNNSRPGTNEGTKPASNSHRPGAN